MCAVCDSKQHFRFDDVMQLTRDVMTKGKEANFNVIRAWATSASPHYALQTSPGNFSEAIFRGLDYALDQARQLDLKVVYREAVFFHSAAVASLDAVCSGYALVSEPGQP